MKKAAKLINLGARRWFRAALADVPPGPARAACLQSQNDDLDFFRAVVDRHLQKKDRNSH
jgi:hypothetical protein